MGIFDIHICLENTVKSSKKAAFNIPTAVTGKSNIT